MASKESKSRDAKNAELHSAAERNQSFSSLRPSAYLSALCGEITVTGEDRRDTQRAQRKPSQGKNESAYLLRGGVEHLR
jgi:hypothetical protein